MFRKVCFIVIFLVMINIVVLFFLFLDYQRNFLDTVCFVIPYCCKDQVNINRLNSDYKNSDNSFVINTEIHNVQDIFLKHLYFLFHGCCMFYEFLRSVSLAMIEKKIFDIKNNFLNKLMHQSFDLLNSELILSTMTVVKIEIKTDSMFWIIQLGAFSDFQKAIEVVNKLKRCNYPVYISPINSELRGFVRIFVGPYYSSKDNVKCILDDLYHLSSLSGKIFLYHEIEK